MASNYSMEYGVDMVFCIDATFSMDPVLDMVKENALHFYQDLKAAMEKKGKYIQQLRIRIVAFRDYLADSEPMLVTPFFILPDEADEFAENVRSIEATGGGDMPEDGLEALAYAMKSPWNNQFTMSRHVIVVWSDAATHSIGYGEQRSDGSRNPNYPKGMPKNFEELSDWWGYGSELRTGKEVMNQSAKRLVLFTPDEPDWNRIRENWNQVMHVESEAGSGVEDIDYSTVLNVTAESIVAAAKRQ